MRLHIYVYLETDTGNTLDITSLPEIINVSDVSSLSKLTTFKGAKNFQLSKDATMPISTLDNTYNFFSDKGYQGIFTREISGEDGTFTNPVEIQFTLKGQKIPNFMLVFDRLNNEYATEVTVTMTVPEGDPATCKLTNNSTYMYVELHSVFPATQSAEREIVLKVDKWSKPYSSAKITRLALEYADVFTGSSIIRASWSENAQNDQVIVQPGIVEQYAEIELYDRYKNIRNMHNRDLLSRKGRIDIAVADTQNTEIPLGSYDVEDWVISATDPIVKLTGNDPSVNFDKTYIERLPIKKRDIDTTLNELFSFIPQYSFRYIDDVTKLYCQNIFTPNSWFRPDTLDKILQKVCTLGMIRMFWLNNEFIVMRCY